MTDRRGMYHGMVRPGGSARPYDVLAALGTWALLNGEGTA